MGVRALLSQTPQAASAQAVLSLPPLPHLFLAISECSGLILLLFGVPTSPSIEYRAIRFAHQAPPAQVETGAVVLDVHAVHVPHFPVEELGDIRQLQDDAHLRQHKEIRDAQGGYENQPRDKKLPSSQSNRLHWEKSRASKAKRM